MDAEARRLHRFMHAVALLVLPLVVLVGWQAVQEGTVALADGTGVVVVLFAAVLVAGEMWPIPVARGEESGDEITVSSTFGFALLLVAPVFYVVVAQAVALVIDWKVRGRLWVRLPFNVAQYALAFIAARWVYALVAGVPFAPVPGHDPDLTGAVAGAAVFLLVNNGLVGVAVSLAHRLPLRSVLTEDLRWQLLTSAPLLGLGPLAAHAAMWNPVSVLLLLMPVVALHRSGTATMQREQESLHDPLTGLANRTLLAAAAGRALQAGGAAMLLLDLDHFKDVNDTLGHAVGDELLLAVAQRLREQAGPDDLVARLGGDEFVVLSRSCTSAEQAQDLAGRICEAVRSPYEVQGVRLVVGCSVGIGLAPLHVDTVEGLLRCADVALYEAKATRGTHALYDARTDQHSAQLLGLQADLRTALEDPHDRQISIAMQPQLDLRTGRIGSVEVLVRWQHPVAGALRPDVFVPIAESTSLIDALMRRVLELALVEVRAWDAQGLHLDLAVNLSARQLSDLQLPEVVLGLLAEHGVPAERLVLEVTESRLMSDPERSTSILRRLQDAGVSISIDDFGTGYSSLSYLQRLAVDELKIDKSFISDLDDAGNAAIVRSTIELGHNLGLRVVAEGVEEQEQADALRAMGCDLLQGYLVGRPVPPAELGRRLLPGAALVPSPRPAPGASAPAVPSTSVA